MKDWVENLFCHHIWTARECLGRYHFRENYLEGGQAPPEMSLVKSSTPFDPFCHTYACRYSSSYLSLQIALRLQVMAERLRVDVKNEWAMRTAPLCTGLQIRVERRTSSFLLQ